MIISAAMLINSKIYTGKRHYNIIKDNPGLTFKDGIQGFVDDKDKFLNRKQAAIEAFKCGQISKKVTVLLSEDLY
jgi:hypothetical protein